MEKRKKPRFLRKDWYKRIKLGRKKKNRVWRAAKGRHSKVREKLKNRQKMPSIGYGMPKKTRGFVKGMKPIMINNLSDLEKIGKNEIGILSGKIGKRKRVEIAKKTSSNIKFYNFKPKEFLEKISKEKERKSPKKEVKKEIKPEVKQEEKVKEKMKLKEEAKKENK